MLFGLKDEKKTLVLINKHSNNKKKTRLSTLVGWKIVLLPFKIVHSLNYVQRKLIYVRLFQCKLTNVNT